MPIPQLKNPRGYQSWRQGNKKYYVNRNSRPNGGSRRSAPAFFSRGFWSSLWGRRLAYIGAGLALLGMLGVAGFLFWVNRQLPAPDQLLARQVAQSTKIYDRTGTTLLYEIYGDEKRTLVRLDEIPDHVKWATITIEDKNFYSHKGISFWAIFRTMVTNVMRGQRAGASTLTQQLIKNAILTNEKTYTRKIKEALLAYKLEQEFSKDEILQMYLNEIPYGSTAYGVEAASQRYFAKSVREVNLAEAAILAALPQAPSRYSPYSSNLDLLIGRQEYILDQMVENQYITREMAEEAKGYQLEFKKDIADIKAPHFVMYIKEVLSEKYGEKTMEQGGLKITTTLDTYKQEIAEKTVTEMTEKNQEKYDASNAGLVAIDPKTGQVLAMVGSRDYFNDEIDGQVNIALSKRQPGSSIKPLVYTAAFMKGYTPNTILYDVVTNFSNDPAKKYEPHNYNLKENGPVSMRQALAGSLNVPAVKTLYLAGVNNVLDLAQELGYTTFGDRDRFGLSLVLGGGEVKMVEHVNAFSAFARDGQINDITTILKVEDRDGQVLEEHKESEPKKVLDANIARTVNSVLSDNGARAFTFGERNWLTLGGRPVAAKTGTTNDYRDAWTIGYTPSLVAGVWVGNNDNTEMKRGADGSVVAAPIWNQFMKTVLGDTPVEEFKKPDIPKTGKGVLDGDIVSGQTVKIDRVSGKLATENTPPELVEEKSFYEPHCILYYVNKDDPRGGIPADPSADPQFALWESRVKTWADKQAASTTGSVPGETPPTEYDDVHKPENIPELAVVYPGDKQTFTKSELDVRIQVSSLRGVKYVQYYINDNLFQVTYDYPFNLVKDISFLANGFHNLRIRACDDVENCVERSLEFNLVLDQRSSAPEPTIAWTQPSSGLTVNNIDFPLALGVRITDPVRAARVNIYYRAEDDPTPVFIAALAPIEGPMVNGQWEKIPKSGTYRLYGELVTWDKKSVRLEERTVEVNNTKDPATAQ